MMLKTAPKPRKRFHLNNDLCKYYRSYYNEHMLRNYRLIFDKTQSFIKDGKLVEYDATSLKASKYVEDDSFTRAPNWILKKTCEQYGTLAGEISYFKTFEDYRQGNIANRYCDRLFFDFDIDDNPEVKELKEEFKNANLELNGREYKRKYVELQKGFRELIFERDLLRDVFDNAKRLVEYLQRYGLKPYFAFSGSKGFHVNVFFNEMRLNNLSDIQKTLARTYINECNLNEDYFDFNVFDRTRAHKRLQRIPYGTHSKTGLITRPLDPQITYDELLEVIQSKNRRPHQFDFNKYVAPAGFNNMLMKLDNEIAFKKAERDKQLKQQNLARKLELQKHYGKNYKSFTEIDLRDIASAYGISGRNDGNKTICICPFHNDTHPSAVIYPQRFYCSTCAISLNYYEFISRLEGTTDKDKILEIARRFL